MEGNEEEISGRQQEAPEEVGQEELGQEELEQESPGQQQVEQQQVGQQEVGQQESGDYYPDEVDEFADEYDYDDLGEDDDITGSEPTPLGGIFQLFDIIHKKKDSTKVSNLNKVELGELGISVRESMRIAVLADTFHHPTFARFFRAQAGIISDSSMSKDGWFAELIVSSKKSVLRESSSNVSNLPEFKKGKWKMFSGTSSGTSSGKNKQ